jgi:hydroxyacylglutathione hydrolase
MRGAVALCVSLVALPSSFGYLAAARVIRPAQLRAGRVHRCGTAMASSAQCQLQIEQFPCLSDNYGFLVHDAASGQTAAIDTPDAKAYLDALDRRGWKLTHILNTHHHHDHAGGNMELKAATGCKIVGPVNEKDRIPGIDVSVGGGDTVQVGRLNATVLDVGGHTIGHVAYHFEDAGVAFVGDSLFAMGCGRMFEGSYPQMFASIERLAALPDDTAIYCAHEYTAANAKFALSVDGSNAALQARSLEVQQARQRGEPTVPTLMKLERETNPFLRYHSADIRKVLGVASDAPAVEAFAAIRKAKDKF